MLKVLSMQIYFTGLLSIFLLLWQITLSNLGDELSKYVALPFLLCFLISRWIFECLHILMSIRVNILVL